MEHYQILPVDRTHNERMLAILKNSPIHAGGMSLYFDKSPDIFKISELRYKNCRHLGFFLGNELMGFASLGYHEAWVDKEWQDVFTFYNFYILSRARGRHFPEKAAKIFFASLQAKYGYYITMKGNRQVESFIIRKNHPWSPPYSIAEELVVKSIIFSVPLKNRTGYRIRNATLNDIPQIVKLLNEEYSKRDLGKRYQETEFQNSLENRAISIENYYVATNRKGEIKGVCLAWDCSSFRRSVVERFSPKFYPLLCTYRFAQNFLKMAPFPGAGENFNELTITDYAVENRDITVMHALLSEIYFRNLNRTYHFMNFASCRSDEFLKASKGFLHRDVVSNIVMINNDPHRQNYTLSLPYIDIAYL